MSSERGDPATLRISPTWLTTGVSEISYCILLLSMTTETTSSREGAAAAATTATTSAQQLPPILPTPPMPRVLPFAVAVEDDSNTNGTSSARSTRRTQRGIVGTVTLFGCSTASTRPSSADGEDSGDGSNAKNATAEKKNSEKVNHNNNKPSAMVWFGWGDVTTTEDDEEEEEVAERGGGDKSNVDETTASATRSCYGEGTCETRGNETRRKFLRRGTESHILFAFCDLYDCYFSNRFIRLILSYCSITALHLPMGPLYVAFPRADYAGAFSEGGAAEPPTSKLIGSIGGGGNSGGGGPGMIDSTNNAGAAGDDEDETIARFAASKLSHRLGIPVFVSCCLTNYGSGSNTEDAMTTMMSCSTPTEVAERNQRAAALAEKEITRVVRQELQ